jgi:hypothetical protein
MSKAITVAPTLHEKCTGPKKNTGPELLAGAPSEISTAHRVITAPTRALDPVSRRARGALHHAEM